MQSERLRACCRRWRRLPRRPGNCCPDGRRACSGGHARRAGADQAAAELHALSYEPHAGCFFDGDDPLRLLRRIPGLLALRVEGAEGPLAELDPFACRLRFHAIAKCRAIRCRRSSGRCPTRFGSSPCRPTSCGRRRRTSVQRRARSSTKLSPNNVAMLRAAGEPGGQAGRIGAAARTATNALRHAGLDQLAAADRRGRHDRAGRSDPPRR